MENKEARSFGVIPVFKDSDNNFYFCLIKQHQGHWGFPKGTQDMGESEEETAQRELQEETGIHSVDLLRDKSFIEKFSFERDGFKYDKSVKYFIGFVPSMVAATPENFRKEIPDLRWVSYKEAKQLLTFLEAKEMLDQVFEFLKNS